MFYAIHNALRLPIRGLGLLIRTLRKIPVRQEVENGAVFHIVCRRRPDAVPARPVPPVLFIVFARPDLTARVFAAIRTARPARLFIAQDGPRANHPEDAEKCRQTRAVATAVDWPCEVQTCFQERNLGVGRGCVAI